MVSNRDRPEIPPEVLDYYDAYSEEDRLASGFFQLEFERTKEILLRVLPKPPSRVLDVGGGAGSYSRWLADQGYEAHLVDATRRLVDVARRRDEGRRTPIASYHVADARHLPQGDGTADAVLLMGPLYHLQESADRMAALREAYRVLAPGGVLAAAAISRFTPSLNGIVEDASGDAAWIEIRERGLRDGRHVNPTGRIENFTTAYLHRPDELRGELAAAGFGAVFVLGIEGPAWMAPEFDRRWKDEARRRDYLHLARVLESEPSVMGASAHLMAVGRRP